MKKIVAVAGGVMFAAGVLAGGYMFADSQPRSFLALPACGASCYRPNELAGLLVSAGIQRTPDLLPLVAKETEKCVAINHPLPQARVHFVVFPKKDIKNIADVTPEDQPYIMECIGVMRSLIQEKGLTNYQVYTNGPGYQAVAYLHFHLVAN